jgi:hypothetical protein
MAEDEKLDETKLKEAAQKAGADAVIFAQLVQVEQKTNIGPSYIPLYTSLAFLVRTSVLAGMVSAAHKARVLSAALRIHGTARSL